MHRIYADRFAALVDAVKHRLDGQLKVDLAHSGMRTVGWPQAGEKEEKIGIFIVSAASVGTESSTY